MKLLSDIHSQSKRLKLKITFFVAAVFVFNFFNFIEKRLPLIANTSAA